MDLVAHEIVGPLEQLSRHDHYRGRAVSHLIVLQLCQLHQDLRPGTSAAKKIVATTAYTLCMLVGTGSNYGQAKRQASSIWK